MMNEFSAKKLGEVLAFALVGQETWQKGKSALEEVFPGTTDQTAHELSTQADRIREIASTEGVIEVTEKKAESTGNKLRSMRDQYIGDSWNDSAELLEWSGFFEGAAVIHWQLVAGITEANGDQDLQKLVESSLQSHSELLQGSAEAIKQVGRQRAQE